MNYNGAMTTFGDAALARTLYDRVNNSYRRSAPKGFTKIVEGSYRKAYLHRESQIVYKVGDNDANRSESANSRRLARLSQRNLGFEVKIPKTRTYRMPNWTYGGHAYGSSVVAQEFALGAKPTNCASVDWWVKRECNCGAPVCYTDVLGAIGEWSRLEDIHSTNVLVDKAGVFWLIDIAQ